MRFTTAWADIASQNVTLKIAIACLTIYSLALTFTSMKLALRDPLIVDRGETSAVAKLGQAERTESEIKAFVKASLEQRFNSSESDKTYLSKEEDAFREKEQTAFSEKNITQKILVNEVTTSPEKIVAETDRLISVGQIRSAFSFPLVVQIEKIPRTRENPYGLVLVRVKEPEKDANKK